MSDSEREAYYEALYGADGGVVSVDETVSVDEAVSVEQTDGDAGFAGFEPGGCEGEAFGEDPLQRFAEEFGDELDAIYERVEADPRIVEARREVSDCVAEKGFDYPEREDELFERYDEELAAIVAQGTHPGDELNADDVAELSDEELQNVFNQGRTFPDEALARLGELQEEEIATAIAVEECGGGFDASRDLFAEVSAEYEQQFIDDNADRLAPYTAD